MLSCFLQGGLGNQLFQIFTTISHALNYKTSFLFLNDYQLGNGENGATIRYTYWNSFFKRLKIFTRDRDRMPKMEFLKEKEFTYRELPPIFNENYMLLGYYQSPKYFDKNRDLLFKLIKLEEKKNLVKENDVSTIDYNNTISMHFRFGDYKLVPYMHPILKKDYYVNCLKYILNQKNNMERVLYFCEEEDCEEVSEYIVYLKREFPDLIFEKANPLLEDWQQMLQMSLCKYNIIANSTFSWWGAYFNTNQGKIVCYPEKWFGPAGHDTRDLFLDSWVKMDSN